MSSPWPCVKQFQRIINDDPKPQKQLVLCRLGQLGLELEERIQTDRAANKRLPKLLTVSMWHTVAGKGTVDWRGNGSSASRSCQLGAPKAVPIANDALALVRLSVCAVSSPWPSFILAACIFFISISRVSSPAGLSSH